MDHVELRRAPVTVYMNARTDAAVILSMAFWRGKRETMTKLKTSLAAALLLAALGCNSGKNGDGGKNNGLLDKILDKSGKAITAVNPTAAARYKEAGIVEGRRVYFVTEINGNRVSSGYRVREKTTYNNLPATVIKTHFTFQNMRNAALFKEVHDRKVIIARDSGIALYSSNVVTSEGRKKAETVSIARGKAIFETRESGKEDKRFEMAVPRGVRFGIEPEWLIYKGPKEGRTFTTMVLDKDDRTLVQESATVLEQTKMEILGVGMPLWRVEVRKKNGPPIQMVFTYEGDVVRYETQTDSGMLIWSVVSKAEAERAMIDTVIKTTVPTSSPLPAWDNFNVLRYEAVSYDPGRNNPWRQYLKDSDYMQIEDSGSKLFVTLKKYEATVGQVRFPIPGAHEPQMEAYLRPTPTIQSERKTVIKHARRITRRERNALRAVAMLAGWVHQNIDFKPNNTRNQKPMDTLESGVGDSTEHADLFASLARSLKIPTRHCLGLLVKSDQAVYHTWVEVWLGKAWVPVDTTVNRVGLPAGYLLTARGNGNGNPVDNFNWTMRNGGIGLRLISATKYHKDLQGNVHQFTLVPDKVRSYVVVEGNWLANLYYGFSLEKPTDWDGRIGRDKVEIVSPDKRVQIRVEAWPKNYAITPMQLEALEADLRQQISGFRQNRAEIRTFGAVRPVESLFVDFDLAEQGAARRCWLYIVPGRGRSYRVSVWAPRGRYESLKPQIERILGTIRM